MKVQSPTLCDPVDCSMSGLPHYLLEVAQVHVHWIIDAIQPSHPLSPSSPSAFNLSQHQGVFQWVICSHQVAKVLELQLQHQSFQWVFRVDFLSDWLVWYPWCPGGSQESSLAPELKNINFDINIGNAIFGVIPKKKKCQLFIWNLKLTECLDVYLLNLTPQSPFLAVPCDLRDLSSLSWD